MINPYKQGSIDTAESLIKWAKDSPNKALTLEDLERALLIISSVPTSVSMPKGA